MNVRFRPIADISLGCQSAHVRHSLILLGLALLVSACSSPEERNQAEIMDRIESQIQLPRGAPPLASYARYYAFQNGKVVARYKVPEKPWPPEWNCSDLGSDGDLRPVECPQQPQELAAGKRRWLKNNLELPIVNDGGCILVNISFDPVTDKIELTECNASL